MPYRTYYANFGPDDYFAHAFTRSRNSSRVADPTVLDGRVASVGEKSLGSRVRVAGARLLQLQLRSHSLRWSPALFLREGQPIRW